MPQSPEKRTERVRFVKCPECKSSEVRCVDSREIEGGRRRSYKCACGARFPTMEVHVPGIRPGLRSLDALHTQFKETAEQRVKSRLLEMLK